MRKLQSAFPGYGRRNAGVQEHNVQLVVTLAVMMIPGFVLLVITVMVLESARHVSFKFNQLDKIIFPCAAPTGTCGSCRVGCVEVSLPGPWDKACSCPGAPCPTCCLDTCTDGVWSCHEDGYCGSGNCPFNE